MLAKLVPLRPDVPVVVAAVDVHPDAAELVHDRDEAEEVDADQVVDRDPGQMPNCLERAARAAVGVGAVDPVGARSDRRSVASPGGSPPRAVEGHLEITREREQRDRLRDRVGPDQHHRVRARGRVAVAGAMVVADHERDRGVLRVRDRVEPLLRALRRGRMALQRGGALVRPEVEAADEPADGHQDDHDQPEEEAADLRGEPALGRRWLPVQRDRGQRPGGRIARPLPFTSAPRPIPLFSVVRIRKRERPGRRSPRSG